ncbi:Kinase, NEK [Giardia muris]|uniref:non-specific serine/threonine protein kinase n=1 Tax=Giardia muris TaxID=5742 RepID=A0A4Z1TAN1_GIAMU|nr:Kinase, NEK [Giardia muris]|eukprot:TNJ29579.1 Kinase, NEK [Giardia muris]
MSLTELMRAAGKGDLEAVRANLKDVGKKDNNGWTALMWAAFWGHFNCIPLLEKEIRIQNSDGRTALMLAAFKGHTDCVRLLLSEAGRQTTRERDGLPPGTTALMLAAYFNNFETVQLLLPYEQGMTDSKGHTARWHVNNSQGRGDLTRVRKLLENEGTECAPPPPDPELLRLQECVRKLTAENESLKKELALSKSFLDEMRNDLSPHIDSEALMKDLADQKAQNLALEKENARLRTESHDMKDLRRRLEEVEEEKKVLLQNLATLGDRLVVVPTNVQDDESFTLVAVRKDLEGIRKHLDQVEQLNSSSMTALANTVRKEREKSVKLPLLERDLNDGEGRTVAEHSEGEKMRRVLMHQSTLPRLPDSLSEYHLTAVLGKGTFGTVYAAHKGGRNVAIKVVSLGGNNVEGRELLRKEAEILLSLDHPNILQCLGTGENDLEDTYILVMDLCCGDLRRDMKERRRGGYPYTDQDVWKTIRDVADALTYIHEKRHVHRDLKPENIFFGQDGRCVLGDFGIARTLGNSSQMGTFVGTPAYMTPEIRQGKYDKSVDVWALGVIGYELCTGRLPFLRKTDIVERDPPAIENRDGGLVTLISRMLSKDPEDRPTAREVLEEAERHQ